MPPPSTNSFEITNYDVLADEISLPISSKESDVGLSLAAHSYHVGNNRLEVLCNIHNRAFSDYQAKGDEVNCSAIVEKIMSIVQNQCVPKGRFLERNSKGEWKEVETAKARLLVRQALSQVQNPSSSAGQTAQELQKKQEDDAEKKRRRRSSLLRRSVSASMIPNLKAAGNELDGKPFDDKKKSSRKDNTPSDSPSNSRSGSPVPEEKPKPRPVFGRSRSVELGGTGKSQRRFATKFERPPIIKETIKMDVLLNTAKTALIPGTDLHGNNRLRVMVNIQTSRYKDSDEESKTKMASDLVSTIENFWGGRILSQVPSMRGKQGKEPGEEQYVKLETDHAVQAMKNLLSGKALEKEEEVTRGPDPDPNIKQGRRASLKAIQSIAATGGDDASATILPSTLPTLPADMQLLRSAAVKSLQKRKQRQGLNSRIRGLTADKAAIFQDGSSSNASVMSASMAPSVAGSINVTPPIPATVSSSQANRPIPPLMQYYRQTSSGASVASTVSNMSHIPPLSGVQRQGSLSNMSTTSSATSMSMNTMNAARTMANINLNAHQSPLVNTESRMMNPATMGPMLGSELHIPNDFFGQNYQQQQQQQYQQRVSVVMPSVPEEVYNATYVPPQPQLTPEQFAMLNQHYGPVPIQGQHDIGVRTGRTGQDRNSLLNSTGSDGLPKFGQGEVEMLIRGLEMIENQHQDHET